MVFAKPIPPQNPLREAISRAYRMDEEQHVEFLLNQVNFSSEQNQRIAERAKNLVSKVREKRLSGGGIDAFLCEYDLSSEEGIALMCLAEALLRIPDKTTIDRLIRDKLTSADWEAHRGKSNSMVVNFATWALMLTGKIYDNSEMKENSNKLTQVLSKLIERSGEPVIRKAIAEAVKIMSRQFVMGQTIEESLQRARQFEKRGYRFSYDMLGEEAKTAEDAENYEKAYHHAIDALAKSIKQQHESDSFLDNPGISVKLSALHPRYEFAQYERVMEEVVPKVFSLALHAKENNISMTIDAEESERLDLSLDIIERVFSDPALNGWEGFGLALQTYQKRAWYVLDWLIDLSRRNKRKIMVRLIKGAYWDSEIKRSQERGLEGYPVFTRKASTDVSYLACARKALQHPDAIFPQFATHNAHTVAAIFEMLGDRRDFEFQCLHGMGYTLYDAVLAENKDRGVTCRIYAPVGGHEQLLSYLVRRLLENGANSSFVNRIVDAETPVEELIRDPVSKVKTFIPKPHPKIPLPKNLYGSERLNSNGFDLTNISQLQKLAVELEEAVNKPWQVAPIINGVEHYVDGHAVYSPINSDWMIGKVQHATPEQVQQALDFAYKANTRWDMTPVDERAKLLEKTADLFEKHRYEFYALLIREGGKTLPDAVSEVREAVDFCRYYAVQAREQFKHVTLPGPTGEVNQLCLHGRGVIGCISPWNFPLAIFTGQITAALAAGNTVIAKPAAQTPLVAGLAVRLMHVAGIPGDVVQLLPGRGSVVGDALVRDERVKGIVFTGSTETARTINQGLANRKGAIPVLIAETGGQNAMVVDSSALPEQVVTDIVTSAFTSAGQRCSALRVLFLQEEVADKIIKMLQGAMKELVISDPSYLSTDIGPVIDKGAKESLEKHVQRMDQEAKLIYKAEIAEGNDKGNFFAPRAYEIKSLAQLPEEVFGPIVHIIRYKASELDKVINDINNTGYGLTLGIHSRVMQTVDYICERARVGNIYVNRNMIGAVVGVQPFGGENLSGTGPKAGGPHYLLRLCTEKTLCVNTTASGGNASLMALQDH